MNHTTTLFLAYGTVCALWWLASRAVPLWQDTPRPVFARPWREVGFAFLGVAGTIALGQLWQRGIRLTGTGGWGVFLEAVNQIAIFLPILLVPVLRGHGWESAWIRRSRLPLRVSIGLALALAGLLVYSLAEKGTPGWGETIRKVFRPSNGHFAVQVLLEDIAIAIVFVRLAAALSPRLAIGLVATLFAAAHIPALLGGGAAAAELVGLVRDAALGVLVVGTVWRGADVAWIWPVHFALDMTQFLSRPG